MHTAHSTSIFTPTLSSYISSPIYPLSCSELAHIILTSFSKPSTESRQLVSLILQSVHDYSAAGISRGLISDNDLKLVSTQAGLLMAIASRLEVDLKNQAWSGDLMTDIRKMYARIIIKLMEYFINTAGDRVLSVVNELRSTLADTRHYLATSASHTIERDIAITARKYSISYVQGVTIAGEISTPLSHEPVEPRAVKTKTGLKSTFQLKKLWKKREPTQKCNDESEYAEKCETDSYSASEGGASDSGVSMGGSESDDEWGWDVVGVAL